MRQTLFALHLGCFLLVASLASGASSAMADDAVPLHLTLRVPSKPLAETRAINVYLPPGYDAKAEVTYPVLYMLDGGELEDFPHLATTLDELIRGNEIPAMLLVGIENTERHRDMTGPTEVEDDAKIAPVVGGSTAFRGFIEHELMPMIRMFYKVNDDAAIIGESAAGLFIVETLFVQPDLFDTYIALDPSLWWNAEQWWREAPSRLESMGDIEVRLFLASAGDNGNGKVTLHLVDALCRNPKAGLTWTHEARPDLRHDNIYRSLERSMLKQAFSGDEMPRVTCDDVELN